MQVKAMYALKNGDHSTSLTLDSGHGEQVGKKLREMSLEDQIKLPDIVFVSPYERTLRTLARITVGWPELKNVRVVEEGRIREQEHGLSLIYNDWRVFQAFHPEQKELHDLEGSYYYRYPQGESMEDVRERNRSWLNTLTRDFAGANVLTVTHHLTILAARANLERLSAGECQFLDKYEKPINLGVTIYRGNPNLGSDGRLILDTYNAKLYD